MNRVLLVEPVFFVHSLVHFRAALGSTGFEHTRFTIATGPIEKRDRDRVAEFGKSRPNVDVRFLEPPRGPLTTRLQCWRENARAMGQVEQILRREEFDLVAYLFIDNILPFLAFSFFRRMYPAHYKAGIAGNVFRHNGLRDDSVQSAKARLRANLDRFILRKAITGGAIRKLSFFDHRCADRARVLFGDRCCGYGVDPIEIKECDAATARQKLHIPNSAFVLLFFGAISDRKGVIESLQILRNSDLPSDRLMIVVAGPVNVEMQAAIATEIEKTKARFPTIFHNGFVADADLPDYFAAADLVVCVYKGFQASSGVLLHAASFGKPALVSKNGVMQDAVDRYGFGQAVSLDNAEEFRAAVVRMMRLESQERASICAGALAYAESMNAKNYMSQFV